jgi:hypothetical protein
MVLVVIEERRGEERRWQGTEHKTKLISVVRNISQQMQDSGVSEEEDEEQEGGGGGGKNPKYH